MISFGMMSRSFNSETTYFTEMAKRANPDIFTCFRFSPAKIHPITELVAGERFDYEKKKWLKAEFPLPKIIYDRCFYANDTESKQSMAIVKWLKSRKDITFLGNGLPNKWSIYEVLSRSALAPYIPETILAASGKAVIAQLEKWSTAILKPVFGSGGAGIFKIKQSGRKFTITADANGSLSEKIFLSTSETEEWLDRLCSKNEYMMQPFLELSDSQNRPFDIRVLLQKDWRDNWILRGKGIRLGHKDGILSNLAAGGEIQAFEDFTGSLDFRTRKFLLLELEEILSILPGILEASFPRLFELGIDIGVSKDQALWVLDTNSKPGRKVIASLNPDLKEILYKAPLEYAMTLSEILPEREGQHL
ncbi:YheC/YheD family protein [Bacillus sp. ISL-35]|uniref:YheC/YheD family endospore coat-associated protein n=1 Tax=Bacillus sp. ISL-35 TaxID=2819122 RepID=UPI001BE88440|nr:YheC/YheD family protein [Bacillus sp. ISL-35]MBT2678061.1 YheC/YheD family protein [Bacillus sp. ISL-35]MBT2705724.1 YheC/YheD family protein [Chryseobacterium sp. ISL-80]